MEIVIVDDFAENREILGDIFKNESKYKIVEFDSGTRIIDYILEGAFSHNLPDIILMDVFMPELNGIDTAERIHQITEARSIPIILFSSFSEVEYQIQAFEAGAVDFIQRPFSIGGVLSRVEAHLKSKQEHDKTSLMLKELQDQIVLAGKIQSSFLGTKKFEFPGIEIICENHPYSPVTGDFFDVVSLGNSIHIVFLADVTGHGVPAALYTMLLKSLSHSTFRIFSNPVASIKMINSELHNVLSEGHYVTGVLLYFDMKSMTLSYVNCGHPNPLHFTRSNTQPSPLEVGGTLLGLIHDTEYESATVKIEKGDRFCLFTDGVIEKRTAEGGAFFDEAGIINSLSQNFDQPLTSWMKALFKDMNLGKDQKKNVHDDVSAIMIEIS